MNVELVEKDGVVLKDGHSTSYIFSPPANKRFISQGIRIDPVYGACLSVRINLIEPNGAYRAFVDNNCGSDAGRKPTKLEINFEFEYLPSIFF